MHRVVYIKGDAMKQDEQHGAKQQPETADVAKEVDSAGSLEEIGGPKGPEPTRYGDWEKAGRCIDF